MSYPGTSPAQIIQAVCLSGDDVGALVYLTGQMVGASYRVTTVDITDVSTMPAIGMIIRKNSSTVCTVMLYGTVVSGVTLIPQQIYFASTAGLISPAAPVARPAFLQVVGQALSDTKLFLNPSMNIARLV